MLLVKVSHDHVPQVLNVLVKESFQDSELQSDIEYLQGFLTDRVNDMRWEGRGGEGREGSTVSFTSVHLCVLCVLQFV